MEKTILAVDIGFGSTKVSFKKENGQLHYEKFTTAVARVDQSEHIKDENVFEFDGKGYYLFDTALKMRSSSIEDHMSYEGLRTISPIILRYLMNHYGFTPDKLVLGISLAMIDQSLDYKQYVSKSLNFDPKRIKLVPQGVGAKIAYGQYSLDPSKNMVDNRSVNYVGVDVGFNTVDIFKVIENSVSSQATEGLSLEGVSKAAKSLQERCENKVQLTLQEAKSVLTTGFISKRGTPISLEKEVQDTIVEYTINLIKMIEDKYSEDIDKMDNILFVGGGAAIIKRYYSHVQEKVEEVYKKDFLMIPELAEYYNVLGYYLIGHKDLQKELENEEQ